MPKLSLRLLPPRFDSLFARLLLMQLALFLVLGVVFGLYFYIERNTAIAALYADRWAPQLAAAAGVAAAPEKAVSVLRRDDAPPNALPTAPSTPRYVVLRRALQAHGVTVDDVMIGLDEAEPRFWLHVTPPGRPPIWLGVTGRFIAADSSRRAMLALLLAMALLVVVSWAFTRRFTRPLERLRERMAAHTPGGGNPPLHEPSAAASAEIVAISAAYTELLARLRQHERERAVLLAGVSHDLRSPLGRIRMAAELLPDAAEVAQRKAAIVRNVTAADRLIESFMDLARSGELAFDETADLAAAARAAVAGFERPVSELAVEAPAAWPWPQANRLLLERLIANLIDNALKHGSPPGARTRSSSRRRRCIDRGRRCWSRHRPGAGGAASGSVHARRQQPQPLRYRSGPGHRAPGGGAAGWRRFVRTQ